jgi:hypothetical protein
MVGWDTLFIHNNILDGLSVSFLIFSVAHSAYNKQCTFWFYFYVRYYGDTYSVIDPLLHYSVVHLIHDRTLK